jgi:enterochelin esterase-like enzyme
MPSRAFAIFLGLVAASVIAVLPVRARAQSALAGTLLEAATYSPILGRVMPYRAYLPPDYLFTKPQRYPVLYMLHGAGGNYTEWSDSFLPERADELILSGLIQPLIVIMPDGDGRTYFANWDNGPRYSDYIAYDIVNEVDGRFRTLPFQSSRAIGGLSMGGLAALQIAMRHPTVFGVVGAHSPSIRLEPDPEFWFLSTRSFFEHDPIWLSRSVPGLDRMTYWLDVGADDWWRENIETLGAALIHAGLNVSWHVLPGQHEAEYWIEHVPDYLQFYSLNLRGDSS